MNNKITSSSYRNIMKSTAVLGGMQVIQMLVVIIRAKFIALILGPTGMGMYSIFQSVIASVGHISNLGIHQSAIRDISQVKESGDRDKANELVSVFRNLTWVVGGLGFLICLVGAPWISRLMFGSGEYTWWFVALSIGLLFYALSLSNTTILQGFRVLKYLSIASLLGAIVSLIIAVPMYYFLGVKGIVPSIVLGYLVSYLIGLPYVRKAGISPLKGMSFKKSLKDGLPIVKLGVILMLSSSMLILSPLILNSFISNNGSLGDVGLIQGAFNIVNQSIIVVVTVLASDYYPRVAAVVNKSQEDLGRIVNQQSELITLMVAPISMILIIFTPFIIQLLLSNEFLVITPIIQWMSLCLPFRCLWIVMSYIILAKGDKGIFLLFDGVIGNGFPLVMNIVSYMIWGITGIGVSFALCSIVGTFVILIVVRNKYDVSLDKKIISVFVLYYIFILIVFALSSFWLHEISLYLNSFLLLCSVAISLIVVNKRTQLFSQLKNKLKGNSSQN